MPKKRKFDLKEYPQCWADHEMRCLIKARYNLLYVVTWEERRVLDNLVKICSDDEVGIGSVLAWDSARGLVDSSSDEIIVDSPNIPTPDAILDYVFEKAAEQEASGGAVAERGPIFVLCDMYRYLQKEGLNAALERRIRALSDVLKRTTIHVVITSPELQLPTSLQKCMTVIDYPLPESEQIHVLVENVKNQVNAMNLVPDGNLDLTPTDKVVRALQGLTFQEAEDALAKAIVKSAKFDISILNDIKRGIVRKGGLLDFLQAEEGLDSVGGFFGLKEFIGLRKEAFSDDARAYGLPPPKGVFLLGLQGTGKSLCAKAVAHELQIPLLKLEMGRVFSSYVGETEANLRRALSLAEAVAPCVLFVDEINMGVGGSANSNDSGVTRRVVGYLLDWMQSKTAPVMLVASANSLEGVPPAMLRKGRFDELFFVDLPSQQEREEIFSIHIRKRGRKVEAYDLKALAEASGDFSGAEIEGVIVEAMYSAFSDNKREFTTSDIEKTCRNCRPLAKMDSMRDYITRLRAEARDRMRHASEPLYKPPEEQVAPEQSRFANMAAPKEDSQ